MMDHIRSKKLFFKWDLSRKKQSGTVEEYKHPFVKLWNYGLIIFLFSFNSQAWLLPDLYN